jgi:hypothetical protein
MSGSSISVRSYALMMSAYLISNDRYINQPERGPSFHTDEFMRGYNSGYNVCSGGSPNVDSYNDGYERGYGDGLDHPIDREIRDGRFWI